MSSTHQIMYASFQKISHVANDAEIIRSCVFWYFYFSFFFNKNFINIIDQSFSKFCKNLSAAMKLRKHWLDIFIKTDKCVFWDAVDRIVVQLRENRKSLKAEMTVIKSVEKQNLLQIWEIEILKINAVTSKHTTDALTMQKKKL